MLQKYKHFVTKKAFMYETQTLELSVKSLIIYSSDFVSPPLGFLPVGFDIESLIVVSA